MNCYSCDTPLKPETLICTSCGMRQISYRPYIIYPTPEDDRIATDQVEDEAVSDAPTLALPNVSSNEGTVARSGEADIAAYSTIATQVVSPSQIPDSEEVELEDLPTLATPAIGQSSPAQVSGREERDLRELPTLALPSIHSAEVMHPPQKSDLEDEMLEDLPRSNSKRVLLILGNIGLSLLVVSLIGLIIFFLSLKNPFTNGVASGPTVVPVSTAQYGPSGQLVKESAGNTLVDPQLSTQIDNNYNPTQPATTFTTQQEIYIVFGIESQGLPGTIKAIWYLDRSPINTALFAHAPENTIGYFSTVYTTPGQGAVELYWCATSNCTDAQLAQIVTFTVSAEADPTPNPTVG
ncbi:hypothetical protein [Tengunoibacter tsumagoiensis]|nr:hypothetical protein [Tengunoibacter tsumagoiensis]